MVVTFANSTISRLEEYNTVDGRLATIATLYETCLRIGKASFANAARGHHNRTPLLTACDEMRHPRHE